MSSTLVNFSLFIFGLKSYFHRCQLFCFFSNVRFLHSVLIHLETTFLLLFQSVSDLSAALYHVPSLPPPGYRSVTLLHAFSFCSLRLLPSVPVSADNIKPYYSIGPVWKQPLSFWLQSGEIRWRTSEGWSLLPPCWGSIQGLPVIA